MEYFVAEYDIAKLYHLTLGDSDAAANSVGVTLSQTKVGYPFLQ